MVVTVIQLGLRTFSSLHRHFSTFSPPLHPAPLGLPHPDGWLYGYTQLHAPRLWRNKELRTSGSCQGQPPFTCPS